MYSDAASFGACNGVPQLKVGAQGWRASMPDPIVLLTPAMPVGVIEHEHVHGGFGGQLADEEVVSMHGCGGAHAIRQGE
jgi:hypothetical protein